MAKSNPAQLRYMTSLLQTVDDDVAQKAVPVIEAALGALTDIMQDLNQTHIEGTAGHNQYKDARRIAGVVEQRDKEARSDAQQNLEAGLKAIRVPDKIAEEVAHYLSRIVVRPVELGG